MYSPKIAEHHIPNLYRVAKEARKPMTHVVNEAVTEYLVKLGFTVNGREKINEEVSSKGQFFAFFGTFVRSHI